MDEQTLKQENEKYKQEIQLLIEKIKELEKENTKYKKNYNGGILPEGFSGYNQ
tara:strand:+ start:769 stop:927 length:159 start_codon:yes stop_codon:yes gene_type:complete